MVILMESNTADIRLKIDDWFEVHSEEMIADLGRLIEVRSVNGLPGEGAPYGEGPRAALALARSMMEERGFEVGEFEDMLITAQLGQSPALMGILAHLDVVDAGEGWDSDPYKMLIKDGRLYGRGASDDKGPSIAAIYAMYCVRDICPELQHGFKLILGSGEEVGCEDIANFISKNELPPHVFTPDADFPVVNVEKGRLAPVFGASWEKDLALARIISITGGSTMNVVPFRASAVIEGIGIAEAEAFCGDYSAKTCAAISVSPVGDRLAIVATGAATHAATPHEGNNAQTALFEMLAAMPFAESKGFGYVRALNRLFPHGDYLGAALGIDMSDDISGALTLNFGVVEFTEVAFSGNFDSRTPACADGIDLPGMVRAAFEREGIELKGFSHSKCHHTPEDSAFVQTLLRVYEEYTGNPGYCLKMGGQTYVHEVPGGVAFGCETPGIINNIHGANEFIGVDDLILSARMFARVIVEMCN